VDGLHESAHDPDMPTRRRLLDLFLPLLAVGAAALVARLLYSGEDVAPALYLVPMAVAVMTGLWRPGLLGSIGALLGWSAGIALGWLIDTGHLWLAGPAAYGLIVAFAPHAIGSAIRVLLRPRENLASG
jgi:hypothetical protein